MRPEPEDICFLPAVELARCLRARELSAVEITRAFCERIETCNARVNAYVTTCPDAALEAAKSSDQRIAAGRPRGPMESLPVSIKDLVHAAGLRTTAGSSVHADFIPQQDALSVARLKASGAVILGKTNTPEFGFKSSTENELFGTTSNPWHPERTAGGSSGGAGAATAAGMSPLSLGTDAGGSIRTPASFCGIVGFKPTFGLVPNGPGFGGASTLVHSGPMTRTVADSALMLDVIAGFDQGDHMTAASGQHGFLKGLHEPAPKLRILWSPNLGYAEVDGQIASCTAEAIQLLTDSGHTVADADFSIPDPEDCFNIIMRAENHITSRHLVARERPRLDPGFVEYTDRGADLSALDYLAAQAERDLLVSAIARVCEQYDLLITPTLAVPPFPHGQRPQSVNGKAISGMNWLSFTYPFNLTGNPAASLPCGWTADGLPVGLQMVGPRFADQQVLSAAATFERLLPWAHRRPF